PVITSPATTATIVAKATAEIPAMKISPPSVPAPPPSTCANNGAAMFPPPPASLISSGPTNDAAAKPITAITKENVPIITIPHTTDERAACAVGTVKNLTNKCDNPAVPKISVKPSDNKSIGSLYKLPGCKN